MGILAVMIVGLLDTPAIGTNYLDAMGQQQT
jgi:hypothetical protein